jgi:hypothetical protein
MCPFYVGQYLEELDFLHELCLTALFSNRFVKFAAVLDNHGKLIGSSEGSSNIEGLEAISDTGQDLIAKQLIGSLWLTDLTTMRLELNGVQEII